MVELYLRTNDPGDGWVRKQILFTETDRWKSVRCLDEVNIIISEAVSHDWVIPLGLCFGIQYRHDISDKYYTSIYDISQIHDKDYE